MQNQQLQKKNPVLYLFIKHWNTCNFIKWEGCLERDEMSPLFSPHSSCLSVVFGKKNQKLKAALMGTIMFKPLKIHLSSCVSLHVVLTSIHMWSVGWALHLFKPLLSLPKIFIFMRLLQRTSESRDSKSKYPNFSGMDYIITSCYLSRLHFLCEESLIKIYHLTGI